MLPSLILKGGARTPRNIMTGGLLATGFSSSGSSSTTFTYTVGRAFDNAPEGLHVAIMLLAWRNAATARTLSSHTYGGTAWTILEQDTAIQGIGMAICHRQLTATEITNLTFAGTGSTTFSGAVFGCRTGIWLMDRLRFAGIQSRKITIDATGLVNSVDAELPPATHLHEGSYLGAMGVGATAVDTDYDMDYFPFTTTDTGNNTDALSNVVAEAPNFNSGSRYTARITKAGAAIRLSAAAFSVR